MFFFFSSRRRHTRCSRDWSSDVCSSDLVRRRRCRGKTSSWNAPCAKAGTTSRPRTGGSTRNGRSGRSTARGAIRSEEHTSELQSRLHLVCRLLLEKKKKNKN